MDERTNLHQTEHNCDVIYEKGPYCGTNIIGPDQTPHDARRLIRAYDICR